MGEAKSAGRIVAGRPEPRRYTIFALALQTFRSRAEAAWRYGFGIYLSLLRPLWQCLIRSARFGFSIIAKLRKFIVAFCRKWAHLSSRILGWTKCRSGSVWDWIAEQWAWAVEVNAAHLQRRQPQISSSSSLFVLLAIIARGASIVCIIWAIRNWYAPLATHLYRFFAVVLMGIICLLIYDFSLLLTFAFVLLFIPIVVLIGLFGITLTAVLSTFFVAMLMVLLSGMIALLLVCLSGFAAGLTSVALVAALLFLPILIGCIGFAIYLLGLILLQCVVLLAIAISRPGQYVWVLLRSIAYVCPSGRCSSLQVPAHVCPDCGSAYSRLWPSRYGVLHHRCEGVKDSHPCHRSLSTLDSLGRNQLNRVCVNCGGQFVSKSSGKLPVTVVGIAGGTSVGKTTMMLMATAELIASSRDKQAGIVAEIDTAEQRILFDRERRRLESGVTVAPTSGSVPDAFILRVKYQKCRSLLYLYDAPGEEFSHIDTFSQHQWLQRADGLMLLVDPASLPGFIKQVGCIPDPEVQASKTPLTDVVNSCIVASEKMIGMQSGEGSSVPLAVVITKADLEAVKQRVGNFSVGINNGDLCRHALCEWGAGSAMQTVEKRFSNIKYFACSALGRTPSKKNTAPFSAYGVLDPLLWILEGTDSLKSTNQRGVVTKEA